MESVLLLSGHYPASIWQSQTNHKLFADRAGFDYRHNSHCTPVKVPYLHKLSWVLENFQKYDYIIWIDDDSYFLDLKPEDLFPMISEGTSFFLRGRTEETGVRPSPINSCFFGVKTSREIRKLLERAISMTENEVQGKWNVGDGGSYGGDQDRLWICLKEMSLSDKENRKPRIRFLDDRLVNGRYQDVNSARDPGRIPKILHLTGKSDVKWRKLRRLQKLPGLKYGLLPESHHEAFPALTRGHHRILGARLADISQLQLVFRVLPKGIRMRLSGRT